VETQTFSAFPASFSPLLTYPIKEKELSQIMCDEETNQNIIIHHKTPVLKDALIIYLLSSFLLIIFGSWLQNRNLLIGLIITQLAFVAAPSVFYTILSTYDAFRTFHISPIRVKTVLITIITTASAFILIGVIMMFQQMMFPFSQYYQDIWEQVLEKFYQIPLIATFFIVSVLPGICEELLFRGFLLRGFRKRYPDSWAIVLVGLLFGLIHVDPYKLLSTTLLGILFGYMVVKTGSIFTGIIAHITNNTIPLLLLYAARTLQEKHLPLSPPSPEEIPLFQTIIALIPLIVIALIVCIAGLRALPRASERENQGMEVEKQSPESEEEETGDEE
jgi:membrane protease YdiL (CAAX protease family)